MYYQRAVLPLTKNIIIINVIMFVLSHFIMKDSNWFNVLALHYFKASDFKPFQILSHMFMHANVQHIASNMLGLYMFGSMVESRLGPKGFLALYLIAGFGAAFLEQAVMYYELKDIAFLVSPSDYNFYRMVGASGCLFGVMAAFGILFAEMSMQDFFIPIPIKAKYFVLAYAVIEVYSGIARIQGDSVAHFAHVGGALFGFILVYYWKRKNIL